MVLKNMFICYKIPCVFLFFLLKIILEGDKMNDYLPLLALDKICMNDPDARKITKLIKRNGKVVGYEIADEFDVTVEQAIELAKQGKIQSVGIAHNKDTVYLKSIPDDTENNNLSNLPTKNL